MSNLDRGWIGCDLDGTLAHYDEWRGVEHIGEPIPLMVERVKSWLAEGKDVRIFTARVAPLDEDGMQWFAARGHIVEWCIKHLGRELPVTCIKDRHMVELYDDRAVQMITNTGEREDGEP